MLQPKLPGLINFRQFLLLAMLPQPQLPSVLRTESGTQRLSLCSEKRKNVLSIHIIRQCKCFQEPFAISFHVL